MPGQNELVVPHPESAIRGAAPGPSGGPHLDIGHFLGEVLFRGHPEGDVVKLVKQWVPRR